MFFQWVLCVGIWLVGVVVNMVQKQPPIFLPALIGGVSWTTGKRSRNDVIIILNQLKCMYICIL